MKIRRSKSNIFKLLGIKTKIFHVCLVKVGFKHTTYIRLTYDLRTTLSALLFKDALQLDFFPFDQVKYVQTIVFRRWVDWTRIVLVVRTRHSYDVGH